MKTGFTLVELLVVIAIIAILTAITLTNYKTMGKNYALERSANNLAQEIRRVEQMAISGETIGDPGEEFYPQGGYGIYCNKNEGIISIFSDIDNSGHYQAGTEHIRDIILEPNVKIVQLSPKANIVVIFRAPNPNIYITNDADKAEITLGIEDIGTKTVRINKAGLVEIE